MKTEDDELVEKYGSEHDFSRPNEYMIARLSRYSFLLCAMSLEAGANALIKSISKSEYVYVEYEKLQTLMKYEIFCLSKNTTIDRGNVVFQRIKELVSCRNEFAHPKPRTASFTSDGITDQIKHEITNNRKYPKYFNFIMLDDSLNALKDICDFVSWVLFDICKLPIKEGATLLGIDMYGHTYTQCKICDQYSIDKRSFGIEEKC